MRKKPSQNLDSGQDSFLDVVSNIVGILIILVVVIGAQVEHGLTHSRLQELSRQTSPPQLPETPADQEEKKERTEEWEKLQRELQQIQASALGVQTELQDMQLQSQRLDAEILVVNTQRHELGTRLALIEREMAAFTDEKDIQKREILLLNQQSVELEERLQETRARLEALTSVAGASGGPKKIEHRQTPIVRSVDTRESHFILQNGRILCIPLDSLIQEYQRRLQTVSKSLITTGVRTDIVGPMSGFLLHAEARLVGGSVEVFWKLQPPSDPLAGETLAMALAPVSQFRHELEKLDPEKDVLTFWIYPSGFSDFLQLKEDLYRSGFAIASRPLPEGTPIAGSPFGQKSVAQ